MFNKVKHINAIQSEGDPNVLMDAARELLYLIITLRQQSYAVNVAELYELVETEIDVLATKLKKAQFSGDDIAKAVYLICAAIDEAVNLSETTIKGSRYRSLINRYYNEEFGGENFFTITEELYNDSTNNLALLKLCYLLLSLGFQGKYALKENGQESLALIREKIRTAILQLDSGSAQEDKKASILTKTLKVLKPKFFYFTAALIVLFYVLCFVSLNSEKLQLHELIKRYYL